MSAIKGIYSNTMTALSLPGAEGQVRINAQRALFVRMTDDTGAYVAPGGGTTDGTTFTAGASSLSPVGGVFDDSVAVVASGKVGEVRLTNNRAMHVNVRDHLGNEATLTGNSLNVNVTNAATGGTAIADKAAFTVGTTQGTNAFGLVRTDVPDLVVDATAASFASTLRRGMHVNLRTQTGTELLGQQAMAGSIPVVIASNQSTLNVALAANQSVNVAQINGVTPLMGTGVMGTGSLRVTIASDNDPLTVKQSVAANLLCTASQGGTWNIGTVTTVTTVSAVSALTCAAANAKVDIGLINAVTPLMGNGITGTGSLRVTIASDNTAFSVNANQAGTWTVQPGNTANTTPWLIDLKNTGGNAILTGNGTTGTGSIRVTIASDNTAFTVKATGDIASGSADSGNPVKISGVFLSGPGTAASTGQRVNALSDNQGMLITSGAPKEWVVTQATTLTSTVTETTIVTAGAAGVFNDLQTLILTNSSATACSVTIKDATAGTTRYIIDLAANGGAVINLPVRHPQATAAANWTATCGTSVASIHISAICVQRK